MTEQEIINKAPKDWTHYADGTYLQFTGIWLRYESGCPEITCCKEWVADIDINDCENIRSRADIERIVELETQISEAKRLLSTDIIPNLVLIGMQSYVGETYEQAKTEIHEPLLGLQRRLVSASNQHKAEKQAKELDQ